MSRPNGARSREKGRSWEWRIRDYFRAAHPVFAEAERGIGQARSAGEVADVRIPLFWPEGKHYKVMTDPVRLDALRQAIAAEQLHRERRGGPRRIPVSICKGNFRNPTATILLPDLVIVSGAHLGVPLTAAPCEPVPVELDLADFMRLAAGYAAQNGKRQWWETM